MRILFLATALLASTQAFSQVEELESPGRIAAIQDRAYRMNHELTLTFGVLPLDAFNKSLFLQAGYTFHFTDYFAWQVGRGSYAYSFGTGLREQLERDFGVAPTTFDSVQWFVGSDLLFTPFYGKAALMNRWVMHFDTHLILGATVFKYAVSSFRPAVTFGLGARLFQNRWVSWRIDVTDSVVLPLPLKNELSVQLTLALNFGATE